MMINKRNENIFEDIHAQKSDRIERKNKNLDMMTWVLWQWVWMLKRTSSFCVGQEEDQVVQDSVDNMFVWGTAVGGRIPCGQCLFQIGYGCLSFIISNNLLPTPYIFSYTYSHENPIFHSNFKIKNLSSNKDFLIP